MKRLRFRKATRKVLSLAVLLSSSSMLQAQAPGSPSAGKDKSPASAPAKEAPITAAQAAELFRSVDQITAFASQDSGLASNHSVKRRLTTRDEVEKYITQRFHEDKDTQRVERSEIVLKKFGLLQRDFQLQSFLVSLLKEQIAGYYDSKTKTVNLLDWIAPDQQKPVLAHELTHALQDEHVDLEKWGDQSADGLSRNAESDTKHLATDEADTARDAVAEGQAMAVFVDWGLKDRNVTLRNIPNIMANDVNNEAESSPDSPILSKAPLLLQQSLLFPYREGLNFEQVLLQDKGTKAAFAGALDRPPATSYEVMNPRAYEQGKTGTLLHMPDIHPIIDAQYAPYDIGAMGELDVRMLTETFAGKEVAATMAAQWDGGLYYAAQSKDAKTPEEQASTKSVALFYLSQWKTEQAAEKFAALYSESLTRKYSTVKVNEQESSAHGESVFDTNEGPVLIVRNGRDVFVSESYDLTLARKLGLLLINAQGGGEQENASRHLPASSPYTSELASSLRRYLESYGMMRTAFRY